MLNTNWDIRFLKMAQLVASWSKDPSTKTGAVIVRANKSISSVGFNGFPQKMQDKEEWYRDREEKYSRIVHCEINALLFSDKNLKGCTLYTWPLASCDRCVIQLIQAGIERFVFPEATDDMKNRWGAAIEKTKNYIDGCGLTWHQYLKEDLDA